MSYKRVKMMGVYCPVCQRKLDIVLADTLEDSICLCFRCRSVYTWEGQTVKKLVSSKRLTKKEEGQLQPLVQALPGKHHYKGQGSQLRQQENGFSRNWLSLAEYERQFGESLGFSQCDFRSSATSCKWCGTELPKGRRSFCKDSCSRNYSQATFTKRSMPSLPYRIACRDLFYCQVSGEDLAQYNRHGVRIPASNGELAIHHLIFVSQNGTDYEKNLLTVSANIHKAYHSGEPEIVAQVHRIRDERMKRFGEKMRFE